MAIRYFQSQRSMGGPSRKTVSRRSRTESRDAATQRDRSRANPPRDSNQPIFNTSRMGFTPDAAGSGGSSGGRVSGDGGGATGAGDGGGYQAQTKFGQSVLPGMLDEAQANPDALIRLWFQQQGMGVHGGSYGAALGQADALKLLWLLTQGEESLKGTPHFLDWTGEHMRNMFTPGGDVISPDEVFSAMQTTDKNNPVYNYLNNPDMLPSDQVQNVGSTLNTSLKGVMPDIVRAAMLARVRELGDQFQALRLQKAGSTPFLGYMTGQGFDL